MPNGTKRTRSRTPTPKKKNWSTTPASDESSSEEESGSDYEEGVRTLDRGTLTTQPLRKSARYAEKLAKKAKLQKEIDDAAEHDEELRQAQWEDRARNAPTGSRNDAHFHLGMVEMGQGDCFVMSTPEGRFVMVDCGSDSREVPDPQVPTYLRRVKDTIAGPLYMGGQNDIDLLLLTHSDTDHYNHLKQVLPGTTVIRRCYHTGELTEYAEGDTAGWIRARCTAPGPKRLFHHADAGIRTRKLTFQLGGVTQEQPMAAATAAVRVDRLDANDAFCVLYEPDCQIYILAAGVSLPAGDGCTEVKNRGSLVTLVVAFGERILLCGDSTRSTETYVLATHGNRLRRVDVVQVAHHGSVLTSSSVPFVERVDPRIVMISAGKNIPLHHHPSTKVVDRYLTRRRVEQTDVAHEIWSWTGSSTTAWSNPNRFIDRRIHISGSWGTYDHTVEAPEEDSDDT